MDTAHTALLVVDVQNDFLPGGALAVPDGDAVVPVANALMDRFDLVVATRDWHPPKHCSFADEHPGHEPGDVVEVDGLEQILWPVHCVQGSPGAAFAPGLDVDRVDLVINKGVERGIDSYSTFFDNGRRQGTGLKEELKAHNVTHVVVCGLATDYCVKFSVLDARYLGLDATVVRDGCRGVDLHAGDVEKALEKMRHAGASITPSNAL